MTLTTPPVKSVKGAMIQLNPKSGMAGIMNNIPNVVQFDINPETLTRSFTPWKAEAEEGVPSPGAPVQPIEVPQKFTGFEISIDPYATKGSLIPPNSFSVEARLAALRKMIEPTKGLIGDLLQSVADLTNTGSSDYTPPEVAPVILWLGARIILPVQVESFTITEHQHDALYYPIRATVAMDLKVLTPDYFRCSDSDAAEIAIAAYEYTRAQSDLLAVASLADLSPLWRLIAPI
ncbi:hypothetical protein [Halomonas stenophila]|uniref:Uncharacterized protein n=1 Tax=Halomonas stenophila TaxID=795312 RepID=A0A7W5EXR1_9GAMM|nr:hypothetical protein [Halomonas stenophila]MBB3232250.1 hypothetical protein [Halomonas stenophila]